MKLKEEKGLKETEAGVRSGRPCIKIGSISMCVLCSFAMFTADVIRHNMEISGFYPIKISHKKKIYLGNSLFHVKMEQKTVYLLCIFRKNVRKTACIRKIFAKRPKH